MRLIRLLTPLLMAALAVPLLAAAAPAPTSPHDWINSPEAYFVSSEERALWDRTVVTDEQAKAFVDQYWQKHGAAFKREVLTRLEAADKYFGMGGVPGSKTAKGRVFMILGSPSNQRDTGRAVQASPGIGADPGANLQNNTIEQHGRVTTQWIYRPEKLPKGLNLPQTTVTFLTDMARNYQNIDNLGQIEPILHRAAEVFVAQFPPAGTPEAAQSVPSPAVAVSEDPLWKAQDNAAGTFFTGEGFISPTEQPFYAASFFIPKSAQALANQKSVLFVGLVKDANGVPAANLREQADLQAYGDAGDRYVDRSIALNPGKYEGMFALFSPEGTTLLASRRVQFEVPDNKATRASRLFLTSKIDTLDKQLPLDPFTFVAIKYAVKGNAHFRTSEKVGFFTVVTNPAGNQEPALSMRMVVSKDGKVLDRTPTEAAPLMQTGPHTWLVGTQFEPNTFKPGHYSIELQLRDLKADKTSEAFTKGYVNTAEFDVEQ
ncbi:MAG TPA: GWxTD domain-containing protein [Thermoanaerobaculia bacterium]|nr:GWxTD domain-containing protein [Thermoanaerobaculia bacterium]